MFQNKTIFVAAMVLVVPSLFVGVGSAQTDPNQPTFDGTNLVAIRIDPAVGTFNKVSAFDIYIQNQGRSTWTGDYEIRIGYNSTSQCLFSDPTRQLDCTQRVTAASNQDLRTISPQQTKKLRMEWTPGLQQVGVGRIVVQIEPLACGQSNPLSQQCDQGPDTHFQDNLQSFAYFVRQAGIKVVPDRAAPPNPSDAHVNNPWLYTDITTPCEKTELVTRVGCKAQPGSLVTYSFNVTNLGNARDTFSARVLDTFGPGNLTARNFTFNFSPRFVSLAPLETRAVTMQVYVPPSEQANNVTNVNTSTVSIQWDSNEIDPDVNSASPPSCDGTKTPGLCQNPAFPSILIGVKHGLNATTNESIRMANVSKEVTFNITLNNTGNFVDVYSIQIDGETAQLRENWTVSHDQLRRVEPFEKSVVKISMIPPENATKGYHHFDVIVQSIYDSQASTRTVMPFIADLQQFYRLDGAEVTSVIHALPAQTAPFVFILNNRGNGPDNVTVRLENVPFQWNAQLSATTVQIPPFSAKQIFLNATAPPNAGENTAAKFFLNTTSQGPLDVSFEQRPKKNFAANMMVLGGPNIEVNAPSRSAFVDAGNTTDFQFVIRNVGNKPSNFSIDATRDQDQLAWSVERNPPYALLAPLESRAVTVTLRAPQAGVVGETSKVFVTVKSKTDAAVSNVTTFEGQISGPDLFVTTVLINATTPYSGDPVELNVVLGNSGNKAPPTNATLKLYFIQGGVPRLIAEKNYEAGALGGGRRISEQIVWDTTGAEGAGTVVARFDEDNLIKEIDDSPASNEVSKPITIRTFDIRVTPATGLSGLPGEKISYSDAPHVFIVEYRGNQPTEPVEIVVTSEHGWGEARFNLALPRGSPVPVLVDVNVPALPGVAEDVLRITVVPSLRPQSTVTATTTTTVLDNAKPIIETVTATPTNVKLGDAVTIRARIIDATGLTSVRAFVITPNNETQSVPLLSNDGTDWSHSQAFPQAGTYRLYVEAVDASANRNTNTSRDTVVTFTVAPGSAPKIELANGQPTTVKTGAVVRFNITDPLGIDSASYSIRGITYELPRPFGLDTSAFQDGVYDVTVTAKNIYGVESSIKVPLTIDNAQPGITKVTLNPASPKANEDVTVRVETDSKVTIVQVVVKKDGQIILTKEATRRGSGAFELLLNPGEGDYSIDVSAKDAAGNEALKQSVVSFSAKPASPFNVPAPGVVGLLVALGVTALLTARRRT